MPYALPDPTLPTRPAVQHLHLELRTSFDELDKVVAHTQAFVAGHDVDDDFTFRTVLLVSEAVTNAIEHGNRFDEAKNILLDLSSTPDHLRVWVEDEGEGFERSQVRDPLQAENLLRDGGRGIFLIEELADEVHYEKAGRRIIMLIRWPEKP